ncbi:fatty acid desaturase [Mycobacterium sp. BK086]|nr:fatty acid desaturase [Mycobacterium sp. BK086]
MFSGSASTRSQSGTSSQRRCRSTAQRSLRRGLPIAITDVADYAHLSLHDVDALAAALDAIRTEVENSRGARDAAYIRRTIKFQRALDAGARLLIFGSQSRGAWALGVVSLAVAKSIENMEISHNVVHGQWDWMNDPEIHSSSWEWDMAGVTSQWRYSHNYRHHMFANVVDLDDDLGFGIMRVTRDVPWRPRNLAQPFRNALLAIIFEWGIALHGLHSDHERATDAEDRNGQTRALKAKIKRQVLKDYVLIPALNGSRWRRALTANVAANVVRNLWAYMVIFCGHFPDGVATFTLDAVKGESKGEWYLRQMLGSANFRAGRVLAFLSGNLCYQIEHHLFPDLPSNRYADIAPRVRALCETYGLPYTTGPLLSQFLQTQRTIVLLAFPDRVASPASEAADDANRRGHGRIPC